MPLIHIHFCKPRTYTTVHLGEGFFGVMGGCVSYKRGPSRGMPPGKILKSGPLRVHFQPSGAKIRVFEQNTDIMKILGFFFFWGGGGLIYEEN